MPSSPTPPLPITPTAVPVKTPTLTFDKGSTDELTRFQRNVSQTLDSVLTYLNLYFGPTPVAKVVSQVRAYASGSQQIATNTPTVLPLTGGISVKGNLSAATGVPHTIGPFAVAGSLGATTSPFMLPGTSAINYWVPAFAGSVIALTYAITNGTSTSTVVSLTIAQLSIALPGITVGANATVFGGVTFTKGSKPFTQFQPSINATYNLSTAVTNLAIEMFLTVTELN